jgi:hypothetical protein
MIIYRPIPIICAVALIVCSAPLVAQGLSLDTEVMTHRYCSEASDAISLRLTLRLTYKNDTLQPIVLLRLTPFLGLTLRDARSSEHSAEVHQLFSQYRFFDASKLKSEKPNARSFVTIPPGASYNDAVNELVIALGAKGSSPLLGTDQYLTIETNTWPDQRNNGEVVQSAWKGTGLLWLDPVQSSPVRIHIDAAPDDRQCGTHQVL